MKKLKTASAAVGRWARSGGHFVRSNAYDLTMFGAVGLVSYGAGLVYAPAGFITAGVLILIGGLLPGRKGA
jgi:hypothetical protein